MKNLFKALAKKIFGKKKKPETENVIAEKNKIKHKRKVGRPKKNVKPSYLITVSFRANRELYDWITKEAEKENVSRAYYIHQVFYRKMTKHD